MNDAYTLNEDTVLTVLAPGVLANDTDVDSDPLTALSVTPPSHGVLTLGGNGGFTCTSDADYNGPDSFTYKANDGAADSNVATVMLTIDAVNDPPVAQGGALSTAQNQPANGILVATDIDGPSLHFSIVVNGAKGTAAITNALTGAYTYTPNPGASGADTFTFKADDTIADSNVATISVTITPTLGGTTTTLTAAPASTGFLQPVVLAARVAAAPPATGTPTGIVQFMDGGAALGAPAPVQNGFAVLSVNTLAAGVHYITARHTDATLARSTGLPVLHTVYTGAAPAASTVTIGSSPNPGTLGQPITFTATVTSGGQSRTGVVLFFADGLPIGSAPVNNAGTFTAVLSTSTLSRGFHSISASYTGDGVVSSGNSQPAGQTVQ